MKAHRSWIWGLLLLAAGVMSSAGRSPNVVVILTDDQGWGDLSVHGNKNLSTPNIDGLARDGAQFHRFYVSPVCSPTRAEFLTGRYHARSGVYATSAGGERMDLDETTIAELFQRAGYATGAFGKWHNGMQYPYHPNGRGFAEFYGFCSGHWGDYFSPPLDHNGRLVKGEGYLTDDFTDKAMAFMERHRERPFFVYLPYNTPHSPMQVPDRWWEKFADKDLAQRHRDPEKEDVAHTRAALAMCENIDWNVGRVLDKLNALKLEEETIVVFFCDNGPNGYRWNGGMKGRKGSTDEGGVRSPLFLRWPGRIPAGSTVMESGAAIDLLPTLTELAGVKVDTRQPLDGMSYAGLLRKRPGSEERVKNRVLFSHWGGRVSARRGPHLLDHEGRLFDLDADPGQRRDVSAERPGVAGELATLVARWRREVLPEQAPVRRPFLLGHAHHRYTQLPARDAEPHGGLERSNRFPNCSYFTGWRTSEQFLTWPVRVAHGGRYEVTVHYTCAPEAVGTLMEVGLGEAAVRGRVTEAHDPPVRGGENDRVPRMESYVKDFAEMSLGVIELPEGEGELRLRAVEIPGAKAIDFRLLMFTRQDGGSAPGG